MYSEALANVPPESKTILVGVQLRDQIPEQVQEYLDELSFLARTAGAQEAGRLVQNLDKPKAATFIGSGKLAELREMMDQKGAELAIFDEELSATQLRNIEKKLEANVLDRTALILQIFSMRAQTAQSRTQVDLARMEYLLPRLRRMWTHLSRERGGIGQRGGAGEQEIETDRRIIRDKIALLRKKLEKIDKQNVTRRKSRTQLVRVALVGYTNAGKSTLMNLLAKTDVLAENKLFATLDTTVRKIVYHRVPFLLTDTVGFIRKLPHKLVESFKSTLDEVREADLLLHVVDVSSYNYLDQIDAVNRTLAELGADRKKTLMVFNKMDQLSAEDLQELQHTWLYQENRPAVFISALHKENIEQLRELVLTLVKTEYHHKYPGLDYYQLR